MWHRSRFQPERDVVQDVFVHREIHGLLQGEPSGGERLDICDRDEDVRADALIVDDLVDDHLMPEVHAPGRHQACEYRPWFLLKDRLMDHLEAAMAEHHASS